MHCKGVAHNPGCTPESPETYTTKPNENQNINKQQPTAQKQRKN